MEQAGKDTNEDTNDLWGERARNLIEANLPSSWSEHPLVCTMYINPLVSGKATVGWLEAVARDYFTKPVKRALSLGCGGGGLERHGLQLKIAKHFDAFDSSTGAIELANSLAPRRWFRKAVTYTVADLNTLTLPEDQYGAVFASQSIHHIENLEHYFAQVQQTLQPGGLFIFNEYVGPNRFQWTDAQLHHANRLLGMIPEALRAGIRDGYRKDIVVRPTVEAMIAADPTEAVRSSDIMPLLPGYFEIVEVRNFGGTLLHLVLDNIAGNLTDQAEHIALLKMLFAEEQRLIDSGELGSDFTLVVARNSLV